MGGGGWSLRRRRRWGSGGGERSERVSMKVLSLEEGRVWAKLISL